MEPITIAICVYNAENYLRQTLQSLEKQTYPELRWLLIDDASTDGSFHILEKFEIKHRSTVKLLRMDHNVGTARVRNRALKEADTRFMMFFDSDDIAKPNLVSCLYKKIKEDTRCIAVSCFAQYINDNGDLLPGGMFFEMGDKDAFLKKTINGKLIFMLPPTLFIREYALSAGGYRTEGFPEGEIRYEDLSEDLDMWSRMSDFYIQDLYMVTLPKVLYQYRKRDGSLSTSMEKQYGMSLKMKYIKCNLKRRRDGDNEITFCDFLEKRTKEEIRKDKREFRSAFYYRKAAFAYSKKRYWIIPANVIFSFLYKPEYIFQKFNANLKGISKNIE